MSYNKPQYLTPTLCSYSNDRQPIYHEMHKYYDDDDDDHIGQCPQRYRDNKNSPKYPTVDSPSHQLGTPLRGTRSPNATEERQQPRPWFGEGSIKSSVFNLTNSTLGAGIVSVPYAIMSLGLGCGMLTTVLLAIASTIATKALVSVLDHTAADSFQSIAKIAGGRPLSLFVQFILLLFNFGSGVGYLICIGDIFTVLITAYDANSHLPPYLHFLLYKFVFLILVTFILLLPLCLVNKLSKIRLASLLGLCALELLVVVTLLMVFQKGLHSTLGPFPHSRMFFPMAKNGIRGIPLLVFSFSCHSNAPSIYAELENQSYRRMAKVSRRSAITALVTYCTMGISGFLIYGYSLQSNILSNFTVDLRNSHLLLVAFIGILVGVILSYPMNIFPCRSSVESLLFPNNIVNRKQSFFITAGLVSASLFIALIIPSLALLFSLLGSVCGACVAFIFPGLFVLLLLPYSISDRRMIKALILLSVGILIAIFGTAVSVQQIYRSYRVS